MVVPLKVSGAFHSRLMMESANEFAEFISKFSIKLPSFPVVSNVNANAYSSAASISELLVKQIYSPVRWTDVIQGIRENGVDNFVECGPGNVLTKLLRQIP
jgi:malonyl CoA-acyl carrier protein transacylase